MKRPSPRLFMDLMHIKNEVAIIVNKPSVKYNNTYYSQSTYSIENANLFQIWSPQIWKDFLLPFS